MVGDAELILNVAKVVSELSDGAIEYLMANNDLHPAILRAIKADAARRLRMKDARVAKHGDAL